MDDSRCCGRRLQAKLSKVKAELTRGPHDPIPAVGTWLRSVVGGHNVASGEITTDDLSNQEVDDVLDDHGDRVVKAGGEVVIVPAERMPTRTGAPAIYRF